MVLKPVGMTKTLLEDLIIGTHFYIAVMERLNKLGELVFVAKKKRNRRRRKKAQVEARQKLTAAEEAARCDRLEAEERQALWLELEQETKDVLGGKLAPTADISPINILLEVDDDVHQ